MDQVQALLIALRAATDEWLRTRWSQLQFTEPRGALLVFVVLLAIALLALVASTVRAVRPGRTHLVFPALLPVIRRSPAAALRHVPMLLFLAGLPIFAIALADPHTGFTREDVSYPGRRVALLVDASGSMILKFGATNFKTQGESTFFTAVAAAEHFIQRRMDGPYRDLVALLQFGNQAYVVTPFTTDYQSIRLSIRLISDPREWGRFSDFGTTIVEGIDQGLRLFKTFDFVNASGNLMILFTDGRDSQLNQRGRTLDQLIADARASKVPVYMVRTAFNLPEGKVREDAVWKDDRRKDRRPLLRGIRRRLDQVRNGRHRPAVSWPDRRSRVQRPASAVSGVRARCADAVALGGIPQARFSTRSVRSRDKDDGMKGFVGFLAVALLLAVAGTVCVTVSRLEGHLADVHEQAATSQFDRAQQSLDAAGAYVGYASWMPGLGNQFRREIRVRQAALQYWQRKYDALVPDTIGASGRGGRASRRSATRHGECGLPRGAGTGEEPRRGVAGARRRCRGLRHGPSEQHVAP